LLINTGTPDAPTPSAVRRFLAQFLTDRRVIDYPRWLWLPLLYGVILNVRPRRSARLYQRIWTDEGSPILTITQRLREKLQNEIAERTSTPVQMEIGMRYGNPSIAEALGRMQKANVSKIVVFPMFPQYSETTTGTALAAVFEEIQTWSERPSLQVIRDYHDQPSFLTALTESIRQNGDGDGKLLFSFHGIPQRYVQAGDPYEEQCKRTAELVTERLNLEPGSWLLAFQSRFGPEAWLQPYTDQVFTAWGQAGLEQVRVVCPGFAIDCLETLDEIQNEGRHIFVGAGGMNFQYIPALNDSVLHVRAIADIITDVGNLYDE